MSTDTEPSTSTVARSQTEPHDHADRAGLMAPRDERTPTERRVIRDGTAHLARTRDALEALEADLDDLQNWASHLARSLTSGGRLLVAGNGGSAAEAQHLTAELVGRYDGERRPLSALALHAETSTLTALANDYGIEELFARQVRAHGRTGDTLLCLSTSGSSPNLLAAVVAADDLGLHTLALTGPVPNRLASASQVAIPISASTTAAIQEAQLVAIHVLCSMIDAHPAVAS